MDALLKYLVEENDKNFRNIFIATYSNFTNATTIVDKLIEYYENLTPEEKENLLKELPNPLSPRKDNEIKFSTLRGAKSRSIESNNQKRTLKKNSMNYFGSLEFEEFEEEENNVENRVNNMIKIIQG